MSPRMPEHPMEMGIENSNFQLSFFCMERKTLELVTREFSVSDRFLEVIGELPHRKTGSISFERSSDWFKERKQGNSTLKYVLRTEMQLPFDLALAVFWDAKEETVHALLHGATDKDATHIEEWLASIQGAIRHPLAPALAIVGIQLTRHGKLLRKYLKKYTNAFQTITMGLLVGDSIEVRLAPDSVPVGFNVSEKLEDSFCMLQDFSNFHRLVQNFRQVVVAVQEVCNELGSDPEFKVLPTISPYNTGVADCLQDALRDYDDLLERSRRLSENVSLLLTTIWSAISQANNRIAQDSNRINQQISNSSRQIAIATGNDSSAMKALAVITVTFLPATSIAAILVMPAFDWTNTGEHSKVPAVKPGIWIWAFFAIILTMLVLYLWRVWYLRSVWTRESQYQKEWRKLKTQDESSMEVPRPYPGYRAWLLKKHTYGHKSRSDSEMSDDNTKRSSNGVISRPSSSKPRTVTKHLYK